jgi:hypothetical protein
MPKRLTQKAKDPTNRDRQTRYRQRMRAAGFVRLNLWIHQDEVERVMKYLTRLPKTNGHPF